MFHFEPITTANIISLFQVVAVIFGFYFSTQSLNATRASIGLAAQSLSATRDNIALATKNAQVQLYNNMLIQGRELQLKFMDGMAAGPDKDKVFIGIIIAYYASCFELGNILVLPDNAKKLLDNDVKESMNQKPFRARWDEVKNLHSKEFIRYVDALPGV
jgi:hypothetical protein